MAVYTKSPQEPHWAQVGIPQHLLAQLISSGVLSGDQCRCLNAVAKDVVWQTLLNNSVKIAYS